MTAAERHFVSRRAPEPVGAFPHARRVGNLLFLSGMGPRSRGEKKIPGVTQNNEGNVTGHDIDTGEELDRIVLPPDGPDPHGLSIKDGVLWYSDAAFPPPSTRDYPEIGRVV